MSVPEVDQSRIMGIEGPEPTPVPKHKAPPPPKRDTPPAPKTKVPPPPEIEL